MKLSLIHFSDVHFKVTDNKVLKKKNSIINAITSRTKNSDKTLCLMNGDIAFSGKKKEYEIAFDFFSDILSSVDSTDFVCIPGNHDCNFNQMDTDTRKYLIDGIKDPKIKQIIPLEKVIVQEEYDDFVNIFSDNWKYTTTISDNSIFRIVDFEISESKKIRFNLFNTAWDSTLNEQPGNMYMPISDIKDKVTYLKDGILNISVLHHPTNWLEPNNKREFDKIITNNSDLILTGHEHESDAYLRKKRLTETGFFEGGVLQESSNPEKSSFNIINIELDNDFSNVKLNILQFFWDSEKEIYIEKSNQPILLDTLPKRIPHLKDKGKQLFINNDETKSFLNDLGAPIVHPEKKNLFLEDIYIYPDFTEELKKVKEKKSIPININKLYKKMGKKGIWFIEGERETGKTSLLKQMYKEFLKKNKIPLYMDAEEVKNRHDLDSIENKIQKKFKNQYLGDVVEQFRQSDNEKKILLLDNWTLCHLNVEGKKELVSKFKNEFSLIIIVSESSISNSSDIIRLSNELEENVHFLKMKNFGYVKREALIRKWINLKNELTMEEDQVTIEVDKYQKKVNEIIGKGYVPQLPIYILIILQSIDNGKSLTDFNNQSNGYYYELLIKQLIVSVEKDANNISTMHNYLSYFAFKMFSNGDKFLNLDDWKKLHNVYLEEYELDNIRMDFSTYRKKLIESNILISSDNDRYYFKYDYVLYFFTAQYIANNISQEKIKDILIKLINNIDINLNANILIFLTHLSKDEFILNKVVEEANNTLSELPELKMGDDIKELNNLLPELPKMVVRETSTIENRKKYNALRDSSDESIHAIKEPSDNSVRLRKDKRLIEIEKAQKISEVIGQILKNYSGSILKETKRSLLRSAYNVSLRSGYMFIKIINSEKEDLVSFISKEIKESSQASELSDQNKIKNLAQKIVFSFVEMICFTIVQKSVSDTGTTALGKTYKNMSREDITPIIKLIICGSYLENFYINPANGYIKDVFNEMNSKNNIMAKSILQKMVAKYMYLFDMPFNERQKIGTSFNIEYSPLVKAKLSSRN